MYSMKFFSEFYNSLFNIAWLKREDVQPRQAWKYFCLLLAILSVFYTIPLVVELPKMFREAQAAVAAYIPDDFRAEVKNGQLSLSGFVQPLIVRDQKSGSFITVIDTIATTTLSLSAYIREGDRGGVLITRDKVEVFNDSAIQAVYMRDVENSTFTKDSIVQFIKFLTKTWVLIVGMLLVGTIIYIGIFLWKLWVVFWSALIVMFVARISKKSLGFKRLFVLGLYSVTLPTVIMFAFFSVGITFPWLHFCILLAFMLAVVLTKTNTSESNLEKSVDNTSPEISS